MCTVIKFKVCDMVYIVRYCSPGPPERSGLAKGERSPLSVTLGAGAGRTFGHWAPNEAPNSVRHNSVLSGLTVPNESG